MNVLIIKHVAIEGPGLLQDFLEEEGMAFHVLTPGPSSHFPKLDDLTHIVLLGGPMNVYEEDRYPFLRCEDLFIKEAIQRGKRILGICLGAQLLSKALGGNITRASFKEIGWFKVSLTEEGLTDPVFSSLPRTFAVFQWHEDTFEIPKGGKLLATAPVVPSQAFRYGENVYGLQFHLEVTREMIHQWMMEYEKEFEHPQDAPLSKSDILTHTEREFEKFREMGSHFLRSFFRQSPPILRTLKKGDH
jgi:GMP synthase (glutamine-hydrolysing)